MCVHTSTHVEYMHKYVYQYTQALGALESALRQAALLRDRVIWPRTVLACDFRVKRLGINPGAPGFAYLFYPHKNMTKSGMPPHILLAGDCADAAYVFRPVPDEVISLCFTFVCVLFACMRVWSC